MTPGTPQIVLVLLVLGVFNVLGNAHKSNTCTSSGTVTEGDPAAVTCIYHQHLENNKQDFYIYKTSPGSEAVIVAICAWEDAGISCDFKPGYNVKVRDHTVTLNISSAHPSHAGNYSCSTLPPEKDTRIEQCRLSVKRKTKRLNISCNTDGRHVSVICEAPEGLHATIIIERHDLTKNTEPVEVMRCESKNGTCSSALNGYETVVKAKTPLDVKAFGVHIPVHAADKEDLYVCKTDTESIPFAICVLKNDEAVTPADPEELELGKLTLPLYAIPVCFVLLVLGVLAFATKRFISKCGKMSTGPASCNSSDAERGPAVLYHRRDASKTEQYSNISTADDDEDDKDFG